jgi:hypothetical protein
MIEKEEDRKIYFNQYSLKRARDYIENNARPLEKARFSYHFNSGPVDDVIVELKEYQNTDGGFGNALESDLRAPESSALCTSVAFQVLREVGKYDPDEMTTKAIRYLLDTFDNEKITWRIIPKTAERYPHAPWWLQEGREEQFNVFSLNPAAELLGCLIDYGKGIVPESLIQKILDKAMTYLAGLEEIEMHDFLCCQRLYESRNIDVKVKEQLIVQLQRLLKTAISLDSREWERYSLRPVQAADRPDSPFYPALRETVMENLDYEIKTFQPNGSWPLTFSWGDIFPEIQEEIKREWSGVFNLKKLLALKVYGRIEGYES